MKLSRPLRRRGFAAAVFGWLAITAIAPAGEPRAPSSVWAAAAGDPPATDTETADKTDSPADGQTKDREPNETPDPDADNDGQESGDEEAADVFVPSEDISEDIDVPFPVDI